MYKWWQDSVEIIKKICLLLLFLYYLIQQVCFTMIQWCFIYVVCTVIKPIDKHFTFLVVSYDFGLIKYASLYYVSLSSLSALRFLCQLYSILKNKIKKKKEKSCKVLQREAAILYRSLSNKDKKTCLSQLASFLESSLPCSWDTPALAPLAPRINDEILSLFASNKDEVLSETWNVRRASNGANW